MRPVSLHLEGFGVFRTPVDISFDDVEYFALIGPTGAGKSTIIDAICFALYGSIPRYADERLSNKAIALGCREARVSLTFDVNDTRYTATRVIRHGKGGDALLEQGDVVIASGARELKPAITQLIGLPFEHFTKCVVLPQGEFAKFLHDKPADRREFLTKLLDLGVYARVGQRAREQAKAAAREVELYEREIESVAFATVEARAVVAARIDQLKALYAEIDAARVDDDADAIRLGEAEARVAAAERAAKLLGAVTAPKGLDKQATELEQAVLACTTAEDAAHVAGAALADLETRLEAAGDVATLTRAHDAHVALVALATEIEAARTKEVDDEAAAERARVLVDNARTHLADLQTAHAADAIAAHLVVGEPCPVCTHKVATTPKRRKTAATKVSEAERLVHQAETAYGELTRTHAATIATGAQIMAQRDALQALIAEHPDADAVVTALKELESLNVALRQARAAAKTAQARVLQANEQLRKLETRAREVHQQLVTERERLLRAGCDVPEDAIDWPAFVAFAANAATAQHAIATEARGDRDAIAAERSARLATLLTRAESDAASLLLLRDEVKERGIDARHELARIDDAIERGEKLRASIAAARADAAVARTLGELLKSDRFEKWMLAEALAVLVEAGSRNLHALSQGQFSLQSSDDEEFVVVDHRNADETRSVRTLSGGETFQASLALALALSDQLASLSAAGGTKLDAIFCDEGFGSLDADTLEAVASTIESLGTTGRMVGIVTHVPALAERVPVRFRVHDGTVTREET